MKNYRKFLIWEDLIKHVENGGEIYYHAPMDRFPVRVMVVKTFKNGKLRIKPINWPGGFTIDKGHLSRICISEK